MRDCIAFVWRNCTRSAPIGIVVVVGEERNCRERSKLDFWLASESGPKLKLNVVGRCRAHLNAKRADSAHRRPEIVLETPVVIIGKWNQHKPTPIHLARLAAMIITMITTTRNLRGHKRLVVVRPTTTSQDIYIFRMAGWPLGLCAQIASIRSRPTLIPVSSCIGKTTTTTIGQTQIRECVNLLAHD